VFEFTSQRVLALTRTVESSAKRIRTAIRIRREISFEYVIKLLGPEICPMARRRN